MDVNGFRARREEDQLPDAAAQNLAASSTTLQNETLSDEMVRVVRETMQPEHVGLWLVPNAGAKDS